MSDDLSVIETKTEDSLEGGSKNQNNERAMFGRKTFISFIAAFTVLVVLLSLSLYNSFKLKSEVATLSGNLKTVSDEINVLKAKNIDAVIADFNEMKESQADLMDDATSNYMMHLIQGAIVNSDFVVERAVCDYTRKDGSLISIFDLGAQPAFSSKYLGQGRFSVSDRELKSSINDIKDQIEKEQKRIVEESGQKVNKNRILFTIKNYEMATYENGVLKLEGE